MSGIVGSKLNIRGSGLVGSLGTDGQHLLSAGAGVTNVFETVAGGGGKIGQVVQAAKTDTFTSTTTDAWVDVTDMTVAITPSAADSKILVSYHVGITQPKSTYFGLHKMVRDINGGGYADFCIGDAASSRMPTTTFLAAHSAYGCIPVSMLFLDSPSWSTGAITYKLQMRTDNTSSIYFNRSETDADADHRPRGISTITAMEVLA